MSVTMSQQIAKHLRDVYFGGNWSVANYKEVLGRIPVSMLYKRIGDGNSILTLACHATYYVGVKLDYLQGNPFHAKDAWSFQTPNINSEEEWQNFITQRLQQAEAMAQIVETFPEEKWQEYFVDEKYGTWYRNVCGCIEHLHYHLGQITLLHNMCLLEEENKDQTAD